MILLNTLLLFILNNNQNRACNLNLCLIQYLMCSYKPAGANFKRVCVDFPNITLLTKSTTPGNIQANFGRASFGNKSLGSTFTTFTLVGSLESSTVVSIDAERAFTISGDKIRLPAMEVLLCAVIGDLAHPKKLRDWASLNAILLPSFHTEAVILDGKISAMVLLKTFATEIADHGPEAAIRSLKREDEDEDESGEDKEKTKKEDRKSSVRNNTDTIETDCDNVMAFLQAVAAKASRVVAAPLSLRTYKRV